MKLVEDVVPITRVATREEILAWCEERRDVLTDLLEHEQLVLLDVERRAA